MHFRCGDYFFQMAKEAAVAVLKDKLLLKIIVLFFFRYSIFLEVVDK